MFFRLPVVRFFNRVINRAAVTVALVLLQIGWLLWAFFSLTAGKVWVNAGLNVLSLFITLYLVRKDENSDYKIIWLVLIGMMPLLGGALYLAFGNKAPAKRMRQRMQAVERQHTADLAQQPGQGFGHHKVDRRHHAGKDDRSDLVRLGAVERKHVYDFIQQLITAQRGVCKQPRGKDQLAVRRIPAKGNVGVADIECQDHGLSLIHI